MLTAAGCRCWVRGASLLSSCRQLLILPSCPTSVRMPSHRPLLPALCMRCSDPVPGVLCLTAFLLSSVVSMLRYPCYSDVRSGRDVDADVGFKVGRWLGG